MSSTFNKIELASKFLSITGLCFLCRHITNQIFPGHIRVINYHHIPKNQFENFKRQIDYLLSIYDPASPKELTDLLDGKQTKKKPSFVLTFDDGFESHGTYVAEYLSSRNITGWFFIPTAAPSVPKELQQDWSLEHKVLKDHENGEVDGRVYGTWSTWRIVNEKHVIASHTHNHVRFGANVNSALMENELNTSFEVLDAEIGLYNSSFCWVGGELESYSQHGVKCIKRSSATMAFTTCSYPVTKNTNKYRIERTNIESSFSLYRLKMSVSGIVDIRYLRKRNRLNKYFDN